MSRRCGTLETRGAAHSQIPSCRRLACSLSPKPDFLAAGDFDADGHWDVVAAHLGSKSLYLLRLDGRGGFAEPERIHLPDALTAFTSGEINRLDGLIDIAVAITNGAASQLLIFESPAGALRSKPEILALPAPAAGQIVANAVLGNGCKIN